MKYLNLTHLDLKFKQILESNHINNKIKESILMILNELNEHTSFYKLKLVNKMASDIEKILQISNNIHVNDRVLKIICDYMYTVDEIESNQSSRDDIGSFKWLYKHIGDILYHKRKNRVKVIHNLQYKYRVYLERENIKNIIEIIIDVNNIQSETSHEQGSEHIELIKNFIVIYDIPLPKDPPFLYTFFDSNGKFKSEPFIILADYFIKYIVQSIRFNKNHGNAIALRIFCLWLLNYYPLTVNYVYNDATENENETENEKFEQSFINKNTIYSKNISTTEESADRTQTLMCIDKLACDIVSDLSSEQKFIFFSCLVIIKF